MIRRILKRYFVKKAVEREEIKIRKIVCLPCHRPTEHLYEPDLYDEKREQSYDKYKCIVCGTEQI